MNVWDKVLKFALLLGGSYGIYRGFAYLSEIVAFKNQAQFSVGIPHSIKVKDKKLNFVLPIIINNPTRFHSSIDFPYLQLYFGETMVGNSVKNDKNPTKILIEPEKRTTIEPTFSIDILNAIPSAISMLSAPTQILDLLTVSISLHVANFNVQHTINLRDR